MGRGHPEGWLRILARLLLLTILMTLGCSPEKNNRASLSPTTQPTTCGEAQSSALVFQRQHKYGEALASLRSALKLCPEKGYFIDSTLFRIADTARLGPGVCAQCVELFEQVSPADRVEYLRARAGLSLFCREGKEVPNLLDRLTILETRELSGIDRSELSDAILEYENVRLMRWNHDSEAVLRHLRAGTKKLCSPEVLSPAIRSLAIWKREDHPIGGLLGFWTIQPRDSMDQETKHCLTRAASELQKVIQDVPIDNRRDVEGLLKWCRENGS